MSAFDDFLERSSKEKFEEYRKDLVSTRGNFSSGTLAEYMDVSRRARNASLFDDEEAATTSTLNKLFIRKVSRTEDYGFIFDIHGTEKAIDKISSGGSIKIYEDFKDNLLFEDESKKELWNNAGDTVQKRLIAEDIKQMMKKTDIQYRTHGDRLHYFVIGKIVTKERAERKVYPLFLFSCYETDQKRLTVEIEQSGFLNFWLDEKILDNEISKTLGGLEITIDQQLPAKLANLQQRLKKLNIATVEELEFDPSFSMIGIITGFETEYVDLAWKEMLK